MFAALAAVMTALVFTPATLNASVTHTQFSDAASTFEDGRFIVNVIDRYPLDDVLTDYPHIGSNVQLFEHVLHAFAANLTADDAIALSRDVRISSVNKDEVVQFAAPSTPATRTVADAGLWGLDRIDQRNITRDNAITTPGDDGDPEVYVFVVDSGINMTHNEFAGRIADTAYLESLGDVSDCNGHGTHVAATAMGTTYGVAPSAAVIPVRVLDCDGRGSIGGVIAAIDFIAEETDYRPAVVNLSLGGGSFDDLDQAVNDLVASGVTVIVAAGNSTSNACNTSPARVASAITVAATDRTDGEASFSNYGSCVDIFAPGEDILSAWFTSDTASALLDGTSMAAPHVAGAVALYLDANPTATPAQVWDALRINATACAVSYYRTRSTQSPNRLLYIGNELGQPCPPRNVSTGIGNASANVMWSVPESVGGTESLTYIVTADPGGATCTTTALSCVVPNLINGGTYSFSVSATNGVGISASVLSAPQTLYTVPPSTFIAKVRTRSRTIITEWQPLVVPYDVSYNVSSSGTTRTCSTAATTCTITKLKNGKRYRLTVSASNFIGEGVASPRTWYVVPGMNTLRDSIKRKKKILLSKFMTTLSAGRKSYSVTKGSCRISSGYLVAPSKPGKCTLKLSVSASGKYPSMYNTVVVRVT